MANNLAFRVTPEHFEKLAAMVKRGEAESVHLSARKLLEDALDQRDDPLLYALNLLAERIGVMEKMLEINNTDLKEFRATVHDDLSEIYEILDELAPEEPPKPKGK
jgi:hypothetical protein